MSYQGRRPHILQQEPTDTAPTLTSEWDSASSEATVMAVMAQGQCRILQESWPARCAGSCCRHQSHLCCRPPHPWTFAKPAQPVLRGPRLPPSLVPLLTSSGPAQVRSPVSHGCSSGPRGHFQPRPQGGAGPEPLRMCSPSRGPLGEGGRAGLSCRDPEGMEQEEQAAAAGHDGEGISGEKKLRESCSESTIQTFFQAYFNKQIKPHLVKVLNISHCKQGGALKRPDQRERAAKTQQQSAHSVQQKHFLKFQALDNV
ncbi:uncharacterized protein LOC144294253 [Canis aureus]